LAHVAEARELSRQRADTWGLENCDRLLMRLARLRGDAEQGAILARDNLILNRDLGVPGSIALDLDALGWIARVHGDHARAARLFAAATAVRDSLGRSILAESRRERDEDLAIAREALGPDAFEAAWAEGRAMSLERAIAYALEAPDPA
jgi:non-specific serine/threonine protein kinase